MTLAALTVAVLLWPSAAARRRARHRGLAPRSGVVPRAIPRGGPWVLIGVPVAAAVAIGAVFSTLLVAALAGLVAGLVARAEAARRRIATDHRRLLALARGLAALAGELRSGRPLHSAATAAAAACGDERIGAGLVRAVRAPDQLSAEVAGPSGAPLRRISGAVLLSAQTGCSLAAVLGAIEDDLRVRHRHEAELHAATAGPRAGALLLAGLPLLGLAMGSGVGADPWRLLTTTGTGQLLLVAGVALEVAGVAWSARLVRRAVR